MKNVGNAPALSQKVTKQVENILCVSLLSGRFGKTFKTLKRERERERERERSNVKLLFLLQDQLHAKVVQNG